MTALPRDPVDSPPPLAVHTGRWQLHSAQRAASRARRAIRAALEQWELGAAADPLARQAASLIQKLAARPADRDPGPIDLRLELRPAHRLLLIQIRRATPERPEPGDRGEQHSGRHTIALVYGHRTGHGRTGTWYTHTFAWHWPDRPATDR